MTLDEYADIVKLTESTEVERACQLAYYFYATEQRTECSVADICSWLSELSLPLPNKTRLIQKLPLSVWTIGGTGSSRLRLHRDYIKLMEERFPAVGSKSQIVTDHGSILPEILYKDCRGYIVSLAKQINASYEHCIFDGCAVLMRRLEEVLLISAYEHLQIESSIKDASGSYQMLEAIVRNAAGNSVLNLSRNSRSSIEVVRELGNFSAHKITYLCRREYIAEKIDGYRALVDELLHKAGMKT